MNKNSVILVVSLAIFLIIAISPVNNLVKLAVMALALIVIIWSRRATFYFVTANKNYTSKDPEKRKKSIDGFKKALQLGGLPDNYTISAASLLIQNGEAEVGKAALDKLASKSGKSLQVVSNAKISASMACWIERDLDGAIKYIEEVKKTAYRDKNLYINGATYYLEKGDITAFNKLCDEWKEKNVQSPALKDLEVVREMLRGNWRKAGNMINDILSLKSYSFADPYVHKAQIRLHYHDVNGAVEALKEALENTKFNACSVITKDVIEKAINILEDKESARKLINGNEEDPLSLVNGRLPAFSDKDFVVNEEKEEKTEQKVSRKEEESSANTDLTDDDEEWLKAHGLS
ncbi:hypothetical protein FYJ80_02660 [Spirochaetales bacterium NM-380-WT-3C1]|uniref:Uncharacterized protein n=1 Tax=Bullifex porci TaxID=2606638 RepID=A0A7X2PB95_9SPIO|nr:hypothetical protein [Bullifex porci]MSU05683.1 hypothetical protein [Bullifex porci]